MTKDYSWAKPLWAEIELYIDNLPMYVDSGQVFMFLDSVEAKIKCVKCKKHFNKFPKPQTFVTQNDVRIWFNDLNNDIKKRKVKGITGKSKTPTRFSNTFGFIRNRFK
jgi:hypothetical protein